MQYQQNAHTFASFNRLIHWQSYHTTYILPSFSCWVFWGSLSKRLPWEHINFSILSSVISKGDGSFSTTAPKNDKTLKT